MKNQTRHAQRLLGLILALVGLMCGVTLMPGPTRLASAQAVAASWSYTGNLNTARWAPTATLLSNGNVLVAGGVNYDLVGRSAINTYDSAELYNPATGKWSYTGNLSQARWGHTATLLANGRILVAGGRSNFSGPSERNLNSTELYDPATGTWSITGNLNAARYFHTATLLFNGKVLVAGGSSLNTYSELYDPATGAWSVVGNQNDAPLEDLGQQATLLPNGKVLVAEYTSCGDILGCDGPGISAALYNPASGTWSSTGAPQSFGPLTLLPNGKVLSYAELYDPATGTWSSTGAPTIFGSQTLLPNGKVLVAGGFDANGHSSNSAELYDPATGTWSSTANLNRARSGYTTTLLSNGKVLVASGIIHVGEIPITLNTAELYDPGTNPINQIDDARTFVHQHYLDFLNREPDQVGWDYWTDQITQCGSDVRCIHERRIGVSAAFFIELEFQDTGYYVYRIYQASFGRQPTFAEFTADRGKVIGGSNLEASKQAFADEWVQRAAFLAAYPNTMSNTEVVNKLFDSAGLTDSRYDPQRQQEIQAMNAGRSRALVLRDVIEIPDFKNIPDPNSPRYSELKQISQYNPAFVLMQYFGYLHRDLDRSGYDFWLDVVNNREPNNYRGMVCSFLTSSEYQLRFSSSVTRSNADCSR